MFKLRYYQQDAKDGVREEFKRHRSTAVILPTAVGKTELYLSIAVEEPKRVLVLVHRDHLITSPVARLAAAGFRDVAIEKAQDRAESGGRKAKIVFASVQSIGPESQARRLRTFDPKEFSLLCIDEGHRAVAPMYRRVKDYLEDGNPDLKTLIVTATPKRKDGVALGNVCDTVAYEMSPGQAAREGWITPPRFFVREVPGLDYSKVDLKGGDLDPDQVAALLLEEEPLQRVVASLAEDVGPTIVFCPTVAVAQTYAAMMGMRYRKDKAVAIHQGSDEAERKRAGDGLKDGSIDFVFNVDVYTEGYDVPRLVRVVWASPTASLVRWTQGCGRGFRPDASVAKHLVGGRDDAPARRLLIEQSGKPFCSIVTYYPSNCRHQICTSVDILGGSDLPPSVKKAAEQVQELTARQATGSNTEEDIKTATIFCDLVAALEEERTHLKAKAVVVDAEYDGLGVAAAPKLANAKQADPGETLWAAAASWGAGEPASEKQIKWLLWKGASRDAAETCTKWRASVARDLFEMGVALPTALGWQKRQALKVRDEMRAKRGVPA